MHGIKQIKSEKGLALLNTLFFILFLGLMGISITTMVIADVKMQSINLDRPRALYAAQSGVDYAIRGVMEYARTHSTLAGLNFYSETIPAGTGLQAQISFRSIGNDSLIITSVGKTNNYSQTIKKSISYIDVSKYGIYASGNVSNVSTWAPIKSNAAVMPLFDLDVLRDIAKPYHYFGGNLTIHSPFTFTHNIAFAEGNINFTNWNIHNYGTFVAGGDITLNTHFITLFNGTMYLPNPGSSFRALRKYRLYLMSGGLIVNGDVSGEKYHFLWWWLRNFSLYHSRSRMNNLLQYSVNGGPLIISNSLWETDH